MRGTLRVLRHLGPSNAKEQVTLEFERTAFVAEPRRDYVRHAAYFFIHGRTFDENLRAARNQIAADRLRAQLLDKGVAVPAPAEVRAYALRHFWVDQAADRVAPWESAACTEPSRHWRSRRWPCLS